MRTAVLTALATVSLAACGQKAVIAEGAGKSMCPFAAELGGFRLGCGQGDTRPAVLQRPIDGCAVGRLQPVLHVPDLVGERAHICCLM